MQNKSSDHVEGFKPLRGVRVIDFTHWVAGPTCTTILAALGAEVIKVESATFADASRDNIGKNPAAHFASVNLGKSSVCIDAKSDEGRELLASLISKSDLVVESFTSGVLNRWGLGYDRLVALSPHIIYVSITGFGHTGRYRDFASFGPIAQAYSGLTHTSGLPGRQPAGWGYSYMDVFIGYMAAAWALAAIHEVRHRGGGPQRLDMSQVEVGVSLLGEFIIDAQVNGISTRRPGFPPGNRAVWPGDIATGGARGEVGAPYGIYRTAGESKDAFCAIAILSDKEWERLVECMGSPDWAKAQELSTATGRIARQDLLDSHLSEWTRGYDKYELMELLAGSGVRCGAVQSGRDRAETDPSLATRRMHRTLTLEGLGEERFEALPIRVDGEGIDPPETWPILGADTKQILETVLGMSDAEIDRLAAAGVISTAAR